VSCVTLPSIQLKVSQVKPDEMLQKSHASEKEGWEEKAIMAGSN